MAKKEVNKYTPDELKRGIAHEMEHKTTIGLIVNAPKGFKIETGAKMIAKDHLAEDQFYYTALRQEFVGPTASVGDELQEGIKVEMEHAETIAKIRDKKLSVKEAAKLIAIDHLKEFPDYYTRLEKIEKTIPSPVKKENPENTNTLITGSPLEINRKIEALIDAKGSDPSKYSSEEKENLRFYTGYGGLDVTGFSIDDAKRALSEYYTPDLIVQKMWALAYKYGFAAGKSVMEPSVGIGAFLKYVPANSTAVGFEINKYSYQICKILYPQFDFYNTPFESNFIKNRDTIGSKTADTKQYDLVIGNPPYGDVGGVLMGMGEKKYTKAQNWVEYFIHRGLDMTKSGGLLIYIIGVEVANGGVPFLAQGETKAKEAIAQKANLIDAYRLPNGVFDRTDVLTDIVVFKKK